MKSNAFLLLLMLCCSKGIAQAEEDVSLRESVGLIWKRDLDSDPDQIEELYIGVLLDSVWHHTYFNISARDSTYFQTQVDVGSVNKLLTAMRVQEAINRNILSEEDSLTALLQIDNPTLGEINLADLLDHRTALPLQFDLRTIDSTLKDKEEISGTQLLKYLRNLRPEEDLQDYRAYYNHTNYAIIGLILQEHLPLHSKNDSPFAYSTRGKISIQALKDSISGCLNNEKYVPLYEPKHQPGNRKLMLCRGLFQTKVPHEGEIYVMTGRAFPMRTAVFMEPKRRIAVLLYGKEQGKSIELAYLVMRMILQNTKNDG